MTNTVGLQSLALSQTTASEETGLFSPAGFGLGPTPRAAHLADLGGRTGQPAYFYFELRFIQFDL